MNVELTVENPALGVARTRLLVPEGIREDDLEATLDLLSGAGADAADLYFQQVRSESFSLEDGRIKEGDFSLEQGVGVRALSGEKAGFAYSDELNPQALREAAQAARAILRQGQTATTRIAGSGFRVPAAMARYGDQDPLGGLPVEDKLALLQAAEAEARRESRVRQVMVSLSGVDEIMLVAASDGTLAADVRPLVRINVSVIVEKDGRRERGSSGGGGRFGYDMLRDRDAARHHAREAVRQALVALEAEPAPAGSMTVVLGPGWPGILLHEAIGHGLEGDFNRKGTSAFSGRLGENVASPLCTVVDDGTLTDRRGSLTVDDEGTPSQQTVLIEAGRLRGYLQDKQNARLMGMAPTGNGRRESYAHLPMPRMTNTYLLPGPHDPEEIIRSVPRGLYAVNFGGGQVDITSGKFVFSASEAYLIENGRIGRPVKGATLIGNGPEVLTRVSMLGHDLGLDDGVGTCGKDGQSVPVGVGQPTLRIDGLTVGGTQTG
ncbi:MAG: metalloprotease TldD [Candidatus Macondimonas sp.]